MSALTGLSAITGLSATGGTPPAPAETTYLTDENGNRLTDENGNLLTTRET